MGFWSRVAQFASKQAGDANDDRAFGMWDGRSNAGVDVNSSTAMRHVAVMACVSILSEDFAKIPFGIFRPLPKGGKEPMRHHPLHRLFRTPNAWQTGFEFREMMQASLVLRGNGFAVTVREACGMRDPQECSVHASKAADTEDDEAEDKRFRRLMLRWMQSGSAGTAIRLEPYRREVGADDDEPPVAHEDAIRLAHKCLRTSKAFLTEAVTHHNKAMGLLDGVVGALDDKAENEPEDSKADNDTGDGGEPEEDDKARQLHRAALLRLKHRAA